MPWTQPAFVVRALPEWDATETAVSLWLVRGGPLAPRRVRVEARFAYERLPGVEPLVVTRDGELGEAHEYELTGTRGAEGRVMVAAVMFDPSTLTGPHFVVRWQIVKTALTETVLAIEHASRAA